MVQTKITGERISRAKPTKSIGATMKLPITNAFQEWFLGTLDDSTVPQIAQNWEFGEFT